VQKDFVQYSKSPHLVVRKGTKRKSSSVAEAPEKITLLRNRYKQVAESVALYEARVASQTAQLDRMNKKLDNGQDDGVEDEQAIASAEPQHEVAPITDGDLRAEEQAIRELEQKRRALEERVASMEKDLGGLLR
jgi:chromosome segregation ATPase